MSDYFETGFVVGQASWHKKENLLTAPPATAEEALKLAGLDWEVVRKPLFFFSGHDVNNHPVKEIPTNLNGLVRSSDNTMLGLCEDRYEIFQNRQGFEWCQPLVDTGWWKFETGGSLLDGKCCWALLKQDETEIIPNDKLLRYMLATWYHTGHTANIIKLTSTRVVCWNTLQAALMGAGNHTAISHFETMGMKYREIQQYYLKTTAAFARQEAWCKQLVEKKMNDGQLEQYVDAVFIPSYATEDGGLDLSEREATAMNKVNSRVKELVVDGQSAGTDVLGIKNTAWGAFNGVTQYIEYEQGNGRVKDRGHRILFGQGAEEQLRAATILAEMTGVNLPADIVVN